MAFNVSALVLGLGLLVGVSAPQASQAPPPQPNQSPTKPPSRPAQSTAVPPAAAVAPGYVIGTDDVLGIVFWRDPALSGDFIVRPDGKISLPLLNDVQAAGLTPDELRRRLEEDAKRYIEDPSAAVVVRQVNSRKVFITGQVQRPGSYPLTAPITVLQLIAVAGGLLEYADAKGILVVRHEGSRSRTFKFNYRDVAKGKKLQQNIELKPGDTVIVP